MNSMLSARFRSITTVLVAGALYGACSNATLQEPAGRAPTDDGNTPSGAVAARDEGEAPTAAADSGELALPAATTAGSKMGINIGVLADWGDTGHVFVDVMKSARGFATTSYPWDPTNHPATVGTDGWPTEDFGVLFVSLVTDPLGRSLTVTYPTLLGTYHVSFTGEATVEAASSSPGVEVENLVYDAKTNTTTGEVVVTAEATSGITLLFTKTKYDATHAGLKNVQLLRPGYAVGTKQVISNEFLKAIAPFSTLRFMDVLCTNGSTVTDWTHRASPTWPTQNDPAHGCLAWENVVTIANVTGRDIWINLPHLADVTSYSTSLAKLLKASLDPSIHVYVEWSNEVWNTEFQQTTDNRNAAVAAVKAGDPDHFNFDKQNNVYVEGYRRIAYEAMLASNAFRAVYGNSAMMTQIRPVFALQYLYQYLAVDALYYINKEFGAPSKFFYGLAGAPYYGIPASNDLSEAQVISDLETALGKTIAPAMEQQPSSTDTSGLAALGNDTAYSGVTFNGIAKYWKLKSLGYEGGPDESLVSNSAAAIEKSFADPAQGTMVESFYEQWFGCGNDLINYYSLSTEVGNEWGLYEDVTVATQKSKAATAIAQMPLTDFKTCK